MRCNPLTITDGCTRYLIACQGLDRQGYEQARSVFEPAFQEEYGFPRAMRTDNGSPFASVSPGGLTRLSVWRGKLGIVPVRIAPGQREQNGRHERMHSTLKEETASPPSAAPCTQQRGFTASSKSTTS